MHPALRRGPPNLEMIYLCNFLAFKVASLVDVMICIVVTWCDIISLPHPHSHFFLHFAVPDLLHTLCCITRYTYWVERYEMVGVENLVH